MSATLRVLTDEEVPCVAGGSMDPIVVTGYYNPWTTYMDYNQFMWIYGMYMYDPYAYAGSYYYSAGGGGGGSAPATDAGDFTVDTSQAGTIDATETTQIANIKSAATTLNFDIAQKADGDRVNIPASYNLPELKFGDLKPAAANMDVKVVLDDGINNGGVGSTQGTAQDPLFVLETNGPTGVSGLNWGATAGLAKDYLAHELAHSTPAAQQFYDQQLNNWRSANPGQPDSGFNNTAGWLATEQFAWSLAREISGGSLSHNPIEGFLW